MTPRARACGAAAIVWAVAGLVGTVGATPATAAARSGFGGPGGTERYAGAGRAEDWQAGQWWVDKSKLKERHAQGLTGHGVDIALIDGPVNTSIPELAGQDVRPTFSTCDESTKEDGPLTTDGPLDDTSFHTTSMAALLVGNGKGTGPGGAGITGVAPGATLRTYSIFNTTDPSKHQNYMCDLTAMPALIDRVPSEAGWPAASRRSRSWRSPLWCSCGGTALVDPPSVSSTRHRPTRQQRGRNHHEHDS